MEAVRPQIAGQLEKEKSWWADHRAVTLSNGLRLISVARPGTPTVAVRAYVRAGSRYDAEERLPDSSRPALGLAHLTEHLLFKGTKSRSQQEIFAAVERMGGALNAGTTKEYTTLCAVMPRHDLRVALSVVAELLTEPALREADVWNEKLVVLEEIRRARDQQGVIHDLFSQTLWKAHPFRHPVHGTLEALGELDREALVAFHRRRYVTGSTVLVVCGDVDHQEVCQLADEAFGSLPAGPEQLPAPVEEAPLVQPRRAHLSKDIGQMHLLIGVPTVDMGHEDRGPLKLIERVLGMGGSARLYQRLREETGLVYSVRTVTAHYEDAGIFAVHTACAPQNAARVEEVVLDEWGRLGREGVNDEELDAAKGNYAGTLARRFETNRAMAGIFGVEALVHQVEPFGEAVERINAVRSDDVMRAARTYLDPGRVVSVSVGRR